MVNKCEKVSNFISYQENEIKTTVKQTIYTQTTIKYQCPERHTDRDIETEELFYSKLNAMCNP